MRIALKREKKEGAGKATESSEILLAAKQASYRKVPMKTELPVDVTEAAAKKVLELINEEQDPELKLRVFVSGGGCSGFQYGFTFEKAPAADDFVFPAFGVEIVIDAMSMQYLQGAKIDYQESLEGAQFVITNPNAVTTCGCGSSFSA